MKREDELKHYQTFEDLEVYQVAREFRKAMYRVAARLPVEEKFALAGQIRRAAVSFTNNIAEGRGRFHFLDQIKFTLQARGSLEEFEKLKSESWHVHQIINGYIRFLRRRTS